MVFCNQGNPNPIRRPFSAESCRITAESLAFWNLRVNYMVKYVGAEGACYFASGEGLKMVLFGHFSQFFTPEIAWLNFFRIAGKLSAEQGGWGL